MRSFAQLPPPFKFEFTRSPRRLMTKLVKESDVEIRGTDDERKRAKKARKKEKKKSKKEKKKKKSRK